MTATQAAGPVVTAVYAICLFSQLSCQRQDDAPIDELLDGRLWIAFSHDCSTPEDPWQWVDSRRSFFLYPEYEPFEASCFELDLSEFGAMAPAPPCLPLLAFDGPAGGTGQATP